MLIIQVCKLLLDNGAGVDDQDQHGNTPLHIACYQGHPDTVEILLKGGARLLRNNQELTALDLAKEEEETDVVKLLEDWIKSHPQVRFQFAHEIT